MKAYRLRFANGSNIAVTQSAMLRRAERGLDNGAVNSWCRQCGTILLAEPDAATCWCDSCNAVAHIYNPCMIMCEF